MLRPSPPYFTTKALFFAEPERWRADVYRETLDDEVVDHISVAVLPEFIYLDVYQFNDTIELGGTEIALMNSRPSKGHKINIRSFMLFDYTQVQLTYLHEGEFPGYGFLQLRASELIVTREESDTKSCKLLLRRRKLGGAYVHSYFNSKRFGEHQACLEAQSHLGAQPKQEKLEITRPNQKYLGRRRFFLNKRELRKNVFTRLLSAIGHH